MKVRISPVLATFVLFPSICLAQSSTPSDVKTYTGLTGAVVEGSAGAISALRAAGRTKQFRTILTAQLMARPVGDIRIPMEAVIEFVCANREEYWKLKSDAEVLTGINASLTDLYKDPEKSTDTSVLGRIFSFFRDLYTLVQSKGGKLPSPTKKELKDVCREDLKTFDAVSHPLPPPQNLSFALEGGIDAVKAVLDVLEPPVRAALQIAQNAKRRQAVRKFFQDDKNVELIKESVKQLQAAIVAQNDHSRKMSLGAIVEGWAPLGQARKLSDIKACADFLSDNTPLTKKNGQTFEYPNSFYMCFDAVWEGYEKPFKNVLEAAAAYDTNADIAVLAKVAEATQSVKIPSKKGTPPKKGDALGQTIASLSSEDEPSEDVVRNIGDLLNLAVAIEKAASQQSRDQIKQSIEKALGK